MMYIITYHIIAILLLLWVWDQPTKFGIITALVFCLQWYFGLRKALYHWCVCIKPFLWNPILFSEVPRTTRWSTHIVRKKFWFFCVSDCRGAHWFGQAVCGSCNTAAGQFQRKGVCCNLPYCIFCFSHPPFLAVCGCHRLLVALLEMQTLYACSNPRSRSGGLSHPPWTKMSAPCKTWPFPPERQMQETFGSQGLHTFWSAYQSSPQLDDLCILLDCHLDNHRLPFSCRVGLNSVLLCGENYQRGFWCFGAASQEQAANCFVSCSLGVPPLAAEQISCLQSSETAETWQS